MKNETNIKIPAIGNQEPNEKAILFRPTDQPACAAYWIAKNATPMIEIPAKKTLLIQILA